MTALPALRANIALHMGVTIGLVTGHTAATTPMGLATKIRFASSSSPMMPRDFLPLRLFQITRALPFALATLSSVRPEARLVVGRLRDVLGVVEDVLAEIPNHGIHLLLGESLKRRL